MLVLSRKIGEALIIGDNVVVSVLTVRGCRVQLGIKAPRYVRVVRDDAHPLPVDGHLDGRPATAREQDGGTLVEDLTHLVLTRKADECLTIGNDIIVSVVKMGGNRVRLGITAPQNVRIVRDEVQARDRASNLQ